MRVSTGRDKDGSRGSGEEKEPVGGAGGSQKEGVETGKGDGINGS